MLCSSCGNPVAVDELTHRNSRLLTGNKLHLCEGCEKMEPRFLIVLYARTYGGKEVAKYIRNKMYVGPEILAKEIF